ncbi:NAD(P)/FAD-dependent oxidoreductase [Oceanospirillum sediminis]|uniref:NAD(P)/FAD-dependent oxidoreductase n=1 Tax=Oceanospirillum sediminis TaxID=2760088 RepID=A0A839ILW6_9GAMM|nr:NAD(P)/FAD-dependent oxidoreductase [Oceanospirillum sediminis]MBB1486215.1 NAD(P)/FAD-dependent oxidoreductase [Oceanospirillum sediminis]
MAVNQHDVIIIGAGAAGLMCAISAGQRQRDVLVIDHARKPGNKIMVSGGGRCNFTNYYIEPDRYLSRNPHFCKSALSRYTQWDFIAMVDKHGLPYHEKEEGQLFSDLKSKAILDMMLKETGQAGARVQLKTEVDKIRTLPEGKAPYRYQVSTNQGDYQCQSLVIATGGLSMPTMGATGFGYQVAEQFGLNILPGKAALVPFTLQPEEKELTEPLSGLSTPAVLSCNKKSFTGSLLFTHRGISGPPVLQISSYWNPGDELQIDLLPGTDLKEILKDGRQNRPKTELKTLLSDYFPARLSKALCEQWFKNKTLSELSNADIDHIASCLHQWQPRISGTEGYRTAEVTLGGVDTDELSSKTMEAKKAPGLYFIGEVVDVSGHLGGFNFQWAWSSGWVAGEVV